MSETLLTGFPVVVAQAVVWGEMDAYRHVNNVVYFRYFENARIEYFRRIDWLRFEPTPASARSWPPPRRSFASRSPIPIPSRSVPV